MVASVEDLGIALRAGLHTGEVELVAGNVRGVAVHAAARDGSGLRFVDRGRHELKGLTGERPLYALVAASD
jgi:class 3 adenylate cyclase